MLPRILQGRSVAGKSKVLLCVTLCILYMKCVLAKHSGYRSAAILKESDICTGSWYDTIFVNLLISGNRDFPYVYEHRKV